MRDDHTKRQFDIIRQLYRDPVLHPTAKLVGVFLCDQTRRFDDPKSGIPAGQARISHPGIAAAVHLSERQVRYAIEALKDGGHLDVAVSKWRGGGRGRAHANTYRPLLKADPQGNFDFEGAGEFSTPIAGLSASGANTEYSTPIAGLRSDQNRRGQRPKSGNQCQKGGTPIAGNPSDSVWKTESQTKEESFKKRERHTHSQGKPPLHQPRSLSEGAVELLRSQGPSPEMEADGAQERGWSREQVWDEFEKMIDYRASEGKSLKNLRACFRRWMTTDKALSGQKRQNGYGGSKILQAVEMIAARDGKSH
jgi:hypothetical protein